MSCMFSGIVFDDGWMKDADPVYSLCFTLLNPEQFCKSTADSLIDSFDLALGLGMARTAMPDIDLT